MDSESSDSDSPKAATGTKRARSRRTRKAPYIQHPDMPYPYTLPPGTRKCPAPKGCGCSQPAFRDTQRLNEHMRRVHDWPRGHEIQPRKNASKKNGSRPRKIQKGTSKSPTAVAPPTTTAAANPPSPSSSTSSLTTLSDETEDEEDAAHFPPNSQSAEYQAYLARQPHNQAPSNRRVVRIRLSTNTSRNPPPSQTLNNTQDSALENELASTNMMPAFKAATNLPHPVINTLVPAATGRAAAEVTKIAAAVARVKAALQAEANAMAVEEAALTAGTPQAPTPQPRFSQADFDAAVHARLQAAAPRIYAAALTVSSIVTPLIYYANVFL